MRVRRENEKQRKQECLARDVRGLVGNPKSQPKRWKGTAPPLNPTAADVRWSDALIWAAAVGAAAGVARVLSRRGATSAVRRYRS